MVPQRYERVRLTPDTQQSYAHSTTNADESLQVAEHDDDLPVTESELHPHSTDIPSSPPPSFRSRVSSRRGSDAHNGHEEEVERSLDDAFGGAHDSDDEAENQESHRLVTQSESADSPRPGNLQRRVTEFPGATPIPTTTPRVYGGGSSTRDGVFANISAKPSRDDDLEEKPPVSLFAYLSL